MARVVIVQNTSLKFATNWSQYIQSWGYGLSVLPIASLTDLAQIKQALMEGARILILDAQGQDNVSAEIEQLNKLQEMLSQPFSVLFVMDTDTQVLESVKIKRFEVVNASVRPAKLRLILEHLNVQY